MDDDVLRRWQRGWSVARQWTDYAEVDGVIVVRVGEPDRRVEYLATEQHATTAAQMAQSDANPAGSSWLKITTRSRPRVAAVLHPLELIRTERLLTISLSDQPSSQAPAPYELDVSAMPGLIDVELRTDGKTAASGRMAVFGADAVADVIYTAPPHRRRGLARAVMSALADAALDQGAITGLLSASPEGLPLYQSLDWSPVADLVVARTRLPSVG
ncbi:GNAT family N-acetyltransferase [Kribbella sp. NPDC050281]|uniref:GNAT family N-acetyltransferase n=1 Tax=Kribbella sp. NPDC050281 TaxID=3155515 RepID=UPI0033F01EAC